MQKPALFVSPLCRQYDPEAKAAIWRLHKVDLIGVRRRHLSSEFAFLEYASHQSPCASLFAGCPRRPRARSDPQGRMDFNSLRNVHAASRPGFLVYFPIGSLTWGGVFIMFAFPLRGPPQPQSSIGLNTMPDCTTTSRNFKTKNVFFIHVYTQLKFTCWGRNQTDPHGIVSQHLMSETLAEKNHC